MQRQESKLMLSGVITYDRVAGCYLSECPQLGIASAGNTAEEAEAALQDGVEGFLIVCAERGTLVKVLHDRGVVLSHFDESTRMFNIPTDWSFGHAVGPLVHAT